MARKRKKRTPTQILGSQETPGEKKIGLGQRTTAIQKRSQRSWKGRKKGNPPLKKTREKKKKESRPFPSPARRRKGRKKKKGRTLVLKQGRKGSLYFSSNPLPEGILEMEEGG